MRRILNEGRDHFAPAVGIPGSERADAALIGIGILLDAEPASVRKRGCETSLGADEVEAVGEQAILVRGEKRRAGEQAQIHRIKVVAKARPGHFRGLDRAAGNLSALDHHHLPTLGGEMHGGSEAVHAGADHNCVVGHACAPEAATAGRLPRRYFMSKMFALGIPPRASASNHS